MSGLSIEELQPVPGILASAKLLIRGTIRGITGDRVEVETGERAPRIFLSKPAGMKRVGCSRVGRWRSWSTIAMRSSPTSVLPISRPRKCFGGSLGKIVNPQKERVTIRLDTGRDVGFYARAVAMEKLAALEVGETADFAVDRAYLLVDVFSLGKPRELTLECFVTRAAASRAGGIRDDRGRTDAAHG
jgi:hypothetical protein